MKPQRNLPNQLQILGRLGENIASSYLEKHGFSIIDRNFKASYGEIDILAMKDGMLIAIEVKTRRGDTYGLPEESVTPRKLHEVVKTLEYYCLLHPNLPDDIRIDVIGIILGDEDEVNYFNHIENVTM